MSSNKKNKVNFIVITGPTATGKTRIAVNAAYQYNGEIISADSRQIYRGMDIGTGKDLNEYDIKGNIIEHVRRNGTKRTYKYDSKNNLIEESKDSLKQYSELVSDSVQIRLTADVPKGLFLSGGFDSSLIALKMVDLGHSINTLVAQFSDHSFSMYLLN